jgi:hypothetical protein
MATKSKPKAVSKAESGTHVALAAKEAFAGTRAAGKAVGAATSKGRTPLIAGGSLLAGLGGGLAVIKHRRR